MNFLKKIFAYASSGSESGLGIDATILTLLDGKVFTLNTVTYTEVYAFCYAEIDRILTSSGSKNREKVADLMAVELIRNSIRRFGTKDNDPQLFSRRVNAYGDRFYSSKQVSAVIEDFERFLRHASVTGEPWGLNAPVLIGDTFSLLDEKQAISSFYLDRLIPLVRRLA